MDALGKIRSATPADIKAGGIPTRFRCWLCGWRFKVGDYWRVVPSGLPGNAGSPLVCVLCDGTDDEVKAKWQERQSEFSFVRVNPKYWVFFAAGHVR